MADKMRRAFSVVILVAIMVLTGTTASHAQTPTPTTGPDLAAIFRQFADAVNQGDVDGALALFTEDATWVRGFRCPPGACVGQAAIRAELEKDVADGHRIDMADIQVSGTTLTARVEVRTDGTRAAGVERIIQVFTLEFREDKISGLRVMPDRTDPETAAFIAATIEQLAQLPPATGSGPASTTDTPLPLALPLGVGLLVVGGLLTALGLGMRTVARQR